MITIYSNIDLDVKKFSHILREFRNLIHPYQQVLLDTFPDEDTTNISWQVVNATCKDIEKNILAFELNSKKY